MPFLRDLFRSAINKYPLADKYLTFFLKHTNLFKTIVNIFSACLLLFFIWHLRTSFIAAIKTSLTIKWDFFYLPILFLLWNGSATIGWKVLIQSITQHEFSFLNLYFIRIQSQALNFILPLFGLGGEVLRSAKVSKNCGFHNSIISVSTDKAIDIASDVFLTAIGVIAAINYLPGKLFFIPISAFVFFLIPLVLIFWKQSGEFLAHIFPQNTVQNTLYQIANNEKLCSASKSAFICHCIEHVLMACEIFLVSRFIGIELNLAQLLFVNTISSMFGFIFFFIPGRIGSYECSLAFAFTLLSLSPTAGLSIALIRRARQFMVCFAGILLMINFKKLIKPNSVSKNSIAYAKR